MLACSKPTSCCWLHSISLCQAVCVGPALRLHASASEQKDLSCVMFHLVSPVCLGPTCPVSTCLKSHQCCHTCKNGDICHAGRFNLHLKCHQTLSTLSFVRITSRHLMGVQSHHRSSLDRGEPGQMSRAQSTATEGLFTASSKSLPSHIQPAKLPSSRRRSLDKSGSRSVLAQEDGCLFNASCEAPGSHCTFLSVTALVVSCALL